MADVTTREYRPEDAQRLTDLLNEIERASGGHPGFVVGDTEAEIAGLIGDVARDTRLLFDGGGALIGAGLVTTPPDGGFRVDLWGGVHPDHLGRGLGRELFGWQLKRAKEIHGAIAPEATWQAESGAVVTDSARVRLFERFGLSPVRYFFEMVADTNQPAVALPAGLRTETYHPDLERALYTAHIDAFADHWGYQKRSMDSWADLTIRSDSFRPDLTRIAFDGEEIAGYLIAYSDAAPDRVYIGQVGTRRPWRRRGLAAALLGETLAAANESGAKVAGLDVDADSPTGAAGVYERAGFTVEYRTVAYRTQLD